METLHLPVSQTEAAARTQLQAAILAVFPNLEPADLVIGYPPATQSGDFSVSCFLIAKKLGQPAPQIATQLAESVNKLGAATTNLVARAEAAGPYLNIHLNRAVYASAALAEVYSAGVRYGQSKIGKGKKVMLEYFSPNTNKPLTIGHLRNIILGWSLGRLFKAVGYKVLESTLYNDRGIAIAKTILGYQLWGNNQTPQDVKQKPDHFVGSFYVKFATEARTNPDLEKQAQKVLQKWEAGDKETQATWQKLMGWVLEGFTQTLTTLGATHFDLRYYESEYYEHGKKIVEQGLAKGVFVKKADGVIVAPLESHGVADKVVLRPDDTSLYITQDLYLATLKAKHHPDLSIHVVGDEQNLYFQQLFLILELLGITQAKNCVHFSYGMIRLPSGRIKSREGPVKGTVADDVLHELETLAKAEISKRSTDLTETEVQQRATQIALGALKFYITHIDPKTTMIFDPSQSIQFTGKTGPYLQYMHARMWSILQKSGVKRLTKKIDGVALTDDASFALIKLLAKFPAVVAQSAQQYAPSHVAEYLYQLAKSFGVFYEQVSVLQAEPTARKARLVLVYNVKTVLASGLALLGIPAPEQM